MESLSPYLESLDKTISSLTAIVKDAREQYAQAEAAAAEAKRASSESPQDSMLQWVRDDAEETTGKHKEFHDSFEQQLKQLLQDRQTAEAIMKGRGEAPDACAGPDEMYRHLEGLDEEVTGFSARVEAALEKCEGAKAATAEAAHALSLSSEDERLQLLLRQANRREQLRKMDHDNAQEQLEESQRNRQAMEALLKSKYATLREVVSYPPELLKKCSSPKRSSWETQLALPMIQTHGEVLPWPEFGEGSHEVLDRLDDSKRIYGRPGCGYVLGSRYARRGETQDEVKMRLSTFMESVNNAAEELSIPMHCCGGSERCMSQADMIMRPAGAHSELASMSKHILGMVLVTCSLQLHRGERLEDALCDPLRREGIMTLLQKAYADAVLDEAPLLVLTDYNVTIFLRRSGDVKDNRLWASEPVWADQQSPPARAAWLNALQQAHKLRFLKPMLPRTGVRHPLEKRHTQPLHPKSHQRQAASESLVATAQIAALNDSAAPPRKRKHAEEQEADEPSFPIRVVRHHMTASGTPQQVTSPASSDDGMHCHSSLAAQLATPNATDLAAVETLLLSNLGLTDEHLLGEPYGYTYKGIWAGKPVAVKVYNLRRDGAVAAYEREKVAYKELEALQGVAIPYFLRSGVLAHTAAPVIVLSYERTVLDLDKHVPAHLHQAMEEALEALHAAGAAHCNVSISKFVVSGNAVRLVDFERLALKATEEQKDDDMRTLDALLPY